jgi:hypothetical protein
MTPASLCWKSVADFMLSLYLTVGVHSTLERLHRMHVGRVADVSEVRAATIFKLEVCRAGGGAIARAISRRLPTTAAWVQVQIRSCGICGEQSGTGAGFLRVLRFPLPIPSSPIAPQSPSAIIRGWLNRPIVAAVPSGLSLTP